MIKIINLLLFLCLAISGLRAQELNVSEFSVLLSEKLQAKDRVRDINSEFCSLIRIQTEIDSISLDSNRGIEKIDNKEGEIWLWVPNGTKTLKILREGFPAMDYTLPTTTTSQTIYLIKLDIILPESESVVYKDTILNRSIFFNTDPPGAKLYVNSAYQGKTPFNYYSQSEELDFSIEKKHFYSIDSTLVVEEEQSRVDYTMTYNSRSRTWFVMATGGYGSMKPSFGFGLQVGKLGRTAYYVAFSAHPVSIKPEIRVDINNSQMAANIIPRPEIIAGYDMLIPNEEGWFYTGSGEVYASKRLAITGGITQQITDNFFLTAGTGYFSRTDYGKALKAKADDPAGTIQEAYSEFNYLASVIEIMNWGMILELGAVIRITNNFIIKAGSSAYYIMDYDFPYHILRNACKLSNEFSIGAGYTF